MTAEEMLKDYPVPYEVLEGEFALGYFFPNYNNSEIDIIFNKQFPRVFIKGTINSCLLNFINKQYKELGWLDE